MNHLLTTLAFQVHRAAKTPGPDEIHDVRVSIRRFSQGLLCSPISSRKREVKKIKRRLKRMMQLTSEIRDRDIALEFLASVKQIAASPAPGEGAPGSAARVLFDMVRRWSTRDFSAKWRNGLSLRTHEIEIHQKRGAERPRRAAQAGREVFQGRTQGRGWKAITQAAAWISIANQAIPLFARVVPPVYGASLDRHLDALHDLQGTLGKLSDYRAVRAMLAGEAALEAKLDRATRRKLKDFHKQWAEFDSQGQLERWKNYLSHVA